MRKNTVHDTISASILSGRFVYEYSPSTDGRHNVAHGIRRCERIKCLPLCVWKNSLLAGIPETDMKSEVIESKELKQNPGPSSQEKGPPHYSGKSHYVDENK
jgi:hypothetical protein